MDHLLKEILTVQGVSGDESKLTRFLVNYVLQRSSSWKVTPQMFFGEIFQENIVLVFGQPRTAAFAHIDTVGFTARYDNQLVPIGGPELETPAYLVGQDAHGYIRCKAEIKDGNIFHDFPRAIQRGTNLSFEQNIRVTGDYIEAAYLDNRLGVYNLLKLCETVENGIIVFSTYEEHGGGSMPFLLKFIYERWEVKQALISDITWITDGIGFNKGVVVSLRDRYIPRRVYLDRVLDLAEKSGIPYQLEVEAHGASDGREIQLGPYPVDWCFIGAPEENAHSPNEKVAVFDLECMIKMYQYLMANL